MIRSAKQVRGSVTWSIAILIVCLGAGDPASESAPATKTKDAPPSKPVAKDVAPAKPKAATPAVRGSQGPRIMSRAEADRRKPRSAFLRPPGASPADRYGPEEPDWPDIPPWRQTSFFGIRVRGQFFIYVLDGSGSMIDEDRFPRATIELRRSVFALRPPQRFEVIFYNDLPIPMLGGPIPRPADLKSKTALLQWLRTMDPEGGTVPLPALAQAIALSPDAIFFLSDGVLPEETVESVTKLNRGKVPIHCIDLAGGVGGDQLRRIAEANGGSYASRAGSLHAPP
jgi:hypothetical protein